MCVCVCNMTGKSSNQDWFPGVITSEEEGNDPNSRVHIEMNLLDEIHSKSLLCFHRGEI